MDYEQLQLEAHRLTKNDINKISKRVPVLYKSAQREIAQKISDNYAKYLTTANPSRYFEIMQLYGRLQALENAAGKIIQRAHRSASAVVRESSQLAYSNEYYRRHFAHSVVSLTEFTPFTFQALNPDFMKYAVTQNERFLLAYGDAIKKRVMLDNYSPAKGTLADLLGKWRKPQVAAIQQSIHSAIVAGSGVSELKKEIAGKISSSSNQIMRIIRTETNRTLNAGGYAVDQKFKKNVPESFRVWTATLDTNTRQQSAQMDGQRENKNGRFVYPNGATARYPGQSGINRYDINERCTVVTRFPGRKEQLRRMRNPATGKTEVITYRDFNTWAKEQGLKYNKSGRLIKST